MCSLRCNIVVDQSSREKVWCRGHSLDTYELVCKRDNSYPHMEQ